MTLRRDEYRARDALGLAGLVRSGDVTAREVLEAAIGEIERLDPALNAVVMRNYEKARDDADAVDRAAPLAGVPFPAKDVNVHVAGFPTTWACRFFADAPAQAADSLLVARWRAAGLVVPARTNTPEFATEFVCEPELYGPTANPWDRTRTPGGSSGGAAAAVASGMVPMAHATDSGGSIRVPAGCCGVFGFKPSSGLVAIGSEYGPLVGGLNCDPRDHPVGARLRRAARRHRRSGDRRSDPLGRAVRLVPGRSRSTRRCAADRGRDGLPERAAPRRGDRPQGGGDIVAADRSRTLGPAVDLADLRRCLRRRGGVLDRRARGGGRRPRRGARTRAAGRRARGAGRLERGRGGPSGLDPGDARTRDDPGLADPDGPRDDRLRRAADARHPPSRRSRPASSAHASRPTSRSETSAPGGSRPIPRRSTSPASRRCRSPCTRVRTDCRSARTSPAGWARTRPCCAWPASSRRRRPGARRRPPDPA